jgi:hypothetical protein
MHDFNKKLAATVAAGALMTVFGTAWSQSEAQIDPNATPQDATDTSTGARILFFKDQGNSPESDPAAHLILIKDAPVQPVPVATSSTTTTTTVEQTTTPADTAPAPAVTDSSTADTTTDSTTAAPVDTTPVLAPRADRN